MLFPTTELGFLPESFRFDVAESDVGTSFHQGLQKEAHERSHSSVLPGFREAQTLPGGEREKEKGKTSPPPAQPQDM